MMLESPRLCYSLAYQQETNTKFNNNNLFVKKQENVNSNQNWLISEKIEYRFFSFHSTLHVCDELYLSPICCAVEKATYYLKTAIKLPQKQTAFIAF